MSPPRNYQIEEFMRGIEQPVSPLQSRHLKVIAELLEAAWDGLLEDHEWVLRHKEEKEVNTLMESRLNSLCEQRATLWSTLVSGVMRGKETINYDGSKLETRPDLSIQLTKRSARLLLLVECKLLDAKDNKTIKLYCEEGLARFVKGQYAWYAREAFMLAYVRDNSTIVGCLTPHLEKHQQQVPDPFLTEQLPSAISHTSHELARSLHGRTFPDNPGTIDVWHLWLN